MTFKELPIGSLFVIDRPAVKTLLFKKANENEVLSVGNHLAACLGLSLGNRGTNIEFDTPVLKIEQPANSAG